eukprot:comp22322_c0_seq1/m.53551 comp22322_c0_seq1/g.53551  ORF comp22322_c0_seq1/g.53551 comp22322_c0_seq1/m.53551 type:complete len:136 (-) comp22322_c0_seq1:3155-3562(-)
MMSQAPHMNGGNFNPMLRQFNKHPDAPIGISRSSSNPVVSTSESHNNSGYIPSPLGRWQPDLPPAMIAPPMASNSSSSSNGGSNGSGSAVFSSQDPSDTKLPPFSVFAAPPPSHQKQQLTPRTSEDHGVTAQRPW